VAFVLVLLIVIFFDVEVRGAQGGLVAKLIEKVRLEAANDQENSEKYNNDQSDEEGLIIEGGLGYIC